MTDEDKELKAMGAVIEALTPLEDDARNRVVDYVMQRMKLTLAAPAPSGLQISYEKGSDFAPPRGQPTDIRSLTAEKQPRSANEMVALVAYYLSELAAPDEHMDTVNIDLVKRYFKMAGFPLPSVLKNALLNAEQAGYLQKVNRGEYKLNPVGYNLVAHSLPRSGSPGPSKKIKHRRKKGRRKAEPDTQ